MSTAPPNNAAAAAAAAAEKAFQLMTIEIWTLYAVALTATILRTYARIRAVGFKGLRPDDYFVWAGTLFYTAQSALGWNVGYVAHGLANNGMTDAQRTSRSPSNPEYGLRVIGSKIQVAGWSAYTALIWCLKLSMLSFYIRLTEGLGRRYLIQIYIGFAFVVATFVVTIMTIMLGCRPFHKYWQINPDPGLSCQAAESRLIIWVSFICNVSTDLYLILIPLPMLWQSTLKTFKKILSSLVLCAGVFIVVCATLKTIFVLIDPIDGAQLAGLWGVREAFTAEITTNLPMLFPMFKSWLYPIFGTLLGSTQRQYKTPSGFQSIGGGGGDSRNTRRTPAGKNRSNNVTVNATFSESEEHMVDDVRLQNFTAVAASTRGDPPPSGIVVSKHVYVAREEKDVALSHAPQSPIRENW